MVKCDDCGSPAEYESLSGIKLCRLCADEWGLACGEKNKLDKDGNSKV